MPLPEGFALPPLSYLLVLLAGVAGVAAGLLRRRPPVDERHVLALVPWMVAGSGLHALYVVGALPSSIAPFAGTAAVYATVAVLAGSTWLLVDRVGNGTQIPKRLGTVGLVALVVAYGGGLAVGAARGTLSPLWPAAALVASVLVAAGVWAGLSRAVPAVGPAGRLGALAVFGHALDGISTAVGVDVLGFGERTPLSRIILEFAASLPTADLVGVGWLFVLVKLVVAGVVVALLADVVREDVREGSLLLGFVAAVGLGPGAHNLLLFTIS